MWRHQEATYLGIGQALAYARQHCAGGLRCGLGRCEAHDNPPDLGLVGDVGRENLEYGWSVHALRSARDFRIVGCEVFRQHGHTHRGQQLFRTKLVEVGNLVCFQRGFFSQDLGFAEHNATREMLGKLRKRGDRSHRAVNVLEHDEAGLLEPLDGLLRRQEGQHQQAIGPSRARRLGYSHQAIGIVVRSRSACEEHDDRCVVPLGHGDLDATPQQATVVSVLSRDVNGIAGSCERNHLFDAALCLIGHCWKLKAVGVCGVGYLHAHAAGQRNHAYFS